MGCCCWRHFRVIAEPVGKPLCFLSKLGGVQAGVGIWRTVPAPAVDLVKCRLKMAVEVFEGFHRRIALTGLPANRKQSIRLLYGPCVPAHTKSCKIWKSGFGKGDFLGDSAASSMQGLVRQSVAENGLFVADQWCSESAGYALALVEGLTFSGLVSGTTGTIVARRPVLSRMTPASPRATASPTGLNGRQ